MSILLQVVPRSQLERVETGESQLLPLVSDVYSAALHGGYSTVANDSVMAPSLLRTVVSTPYGAQRPRPSSTLYSVRTEDSR